MTDPTSTAEASPFATADASWRGRLRVKVRPPTKAELALVVSVACWIKDYLGLGL